MRPHDAENENWPYRAPRRALHLVALAIATYLCSPGAPSWALGQADADLQCLALTIYHESRGEPEVGQTAVAHVVVNRSKDKRFPRTICDVVYQHVADATLGCEFSWTCDAVSDRPKDLTAWRDSVRIARRVYWGYAPDPTAGAMWYHANHVEPKWAAELGAPQRFGQHLFYRVSDAPDIALIGSVEQAPAEPRRPATSSRAAEALRPQLSDTAKSFLQQLRVTMTINAANPKDRAVRINDFMYHQGDELAPGLTLASITPAAIVVRYQDRWFRFTL